MALRQSAHRAGEVKRGDCLLRAWPLLFLALALGGISACAQGSGSNYGQSFGAISLPAGQSQQVQLGSSYKLVQVCNDFASTGTATAVIDDRPTTTLPPGRCAQDYGNRIQFANTGGGVANLTYRSIVETFTP